MQRIMPEINSEDMSHGPVMKEVFNQAEAESFVERNLHIAESQELQEDICIDYAYPAGSGASRFAGGDLALLAAGYASLEGLRSLGLKDASREIIEEAVFKALGKGDIEKGKSKFHIHTDEEHWGMGADLLTRLSGCGFLRNLLERDANFSDETDRGHLQYVLSKIVSIKIPTILKREQGVHPQAVFVVQRVKRLDLPDAKLRDKDNLLSFAESANQPMYALDSKESGRENKRSYAYVYNLGAANMRLREVAQYLKEEYEPGGSPIPDVEESVSEKLKEAEDVQRDRTVAALAGDLPVYDVFVNPYTKNHKVVRRL